MRMSDWSSDVCSSYLRAIGDAVVDLVGDQADAVRRAILRQRLKRRAVQHRSGRIGGACDDQPVERRLRHRPVEQRRRRLKAVAGLRWQGPGMDAEGREYVDRKSGV